MVMFELTSIFGGATTDLRRLPRLCTSTYHISMIMHACLCQAQAATASTAAFTDVHQHEPCHGCGTTAAPSWRPADLSGERCAGLLVPNDGAWPAGQYALQLYVETCLEAARA